MTDVLNPNSYKNLPLQALPNNQALNSRTFRPPPLDASLSIPELFDWHLENTPNHPLFVFNEDDGSEKIVYWPEAVRAAHRVGRMVLSRQKEHGPSRPLIGILCAADTITSFITQIGIVRANCVAFPISIRNSAAAVAHLLTKTNVTHLLVGQEPAYQELASSAFEIMRKTGTPLPNISAMFSFDEVMKADDVFEPLPYVKFEWDDPAVLMHSSGSTAFPKPIVWSHYRYFLLSLVPYFGERDFTGLRLGIQSMPMYHGMGMMQVGWTAACGVVLATFKPQTPAVSVTPDNLLKSFVDTKTDVGFCVPIFVEMWARNSAHVQILKTMRGILYGGGPLAKKVGDYLTEQGVNIFVLYGLSECGIISPILPHPPGIDWQYFKIPANIRVHYEYEDDGRAELIILPGSHLIPSVLNTTVDGVGAYATSDLLEPHPTKSNYWRVFGRTDDQIMHNNGEKTNPGPLEAILNQDPHVSASVMFGRGKFNAGVLVDPILEYKFDPSDSERLATFRNLIWPTVEKMNEFAPQHSRLFKEMILVSSPTKVFTFTAKLTPRRQAITENYSAEIEALYAAVEETTRAAASVPTPRHWSLEETTSFVRKIVYSVLKRPVENTDDLFLRGCDSLQATWIRNSILHTLRENAKVNLRGISATFVYQFPTIAKLARFVSDIVNVGVSGSRAHASERATVTTMLELAEKYSGDYLKHTGSAPLPPKDVVLVSGTTGGLGSILLARLVQSPAVAHIYAINRQSEVGTNLLDRQQQRFLEWGLNPELLQSDKITFIETDMSANHLGLSEMQYEQIRTTVTHIIHNAYRVNFALTLCSFEPNIRAARYMVDLALSSSYSTPPRLLFTSSIGVVQNYPNPGVIPETPIPPESALANGYTQSKWVVERLLQFAQRHTPLQPVSVRIGQIAGGITGAWNQTDWFPVLLKSSQYLGCLPMLDKEISWMPADSVAEAIVDMRNSPYSVLHLVHPRPAHWSSIMTPISRLLDLATVPYSDWLNRLQARGQSETTVDTEVQVQANPALLLIDFFSYAQSSQALVEREAMGMRSLDMSRASEIAPALGEEQLGNIGEKDATAWVRYWQRTGFLSA